MLFSVIILSYNSQRTLNRCLSSVTEALAGFEQASEIFVVDNNSTDDSRHILAEHLNRNSAICPILYKKNVGTTVSRNAALKKATGEYVLILDSDAYMTFDCLSGLKGRLDQDRGVGIACPRMTYADGRHQLSTDAFPTPVRKLSRLLNLAKLSAESTPESGTVDYAVSACWLLPRSVVEKVGLLDEAIFYAPEDVDYCIRVWLAGFSIYYDASESVKIVHDAQELSRQFKISRFHIEHAKGLWYLFKKYNYLFSQAPLRRRIHDALISSWAKTARQ